MNCSLAPVQEDRWACLACCGRCSSVVSHPSLLEGGEVTLGCRLRNDLYCVEWDVKLYHAIPYHARLTTLRLSDNQLYSGRTVWQGQSNQYHTKPLNSSLCLHYSTLTRLMNLGRQAVIN